jgi:hypothetical protein
LNEAKQAVPSDILCGIGVRFNCMGGEIAPQSLRYSGMQEFRERRRWQHFLVLQPDWNIAVGKVSLSVPSEDHYCSVV